MKVLLTGAAGQLGHALRQRAPEGMELIATSRSGDGGGLLPLDLADAGAYTAVDRAESDPEPALAVNGGAPRAFAEALADTGGRLLQVSTDFMFNGQQGSPYRPECPRSGAKPWASCWRPWYDLNRGKAQPAQCY